MHKIGISHSNSCPWTLEENCLVSVKKSRVSFLGLQLTFPSKINLLSGVPDAWDRWVKCVIIILKFVSSLKIQSSLSDSSHYGKKKHVLFSK